MIEYKVEYIGQSKAGNPLFAAYKYVSGKYVTTLINYTSAADCHAYIKQIIAGEGSYVVVPKEVKQIIFN
jgi:hypothetical protein